MNINQMFDKTQMILWWKRALSSAIMGWENDVETGVFEISINLKLLAHRFSIQMSKKCKIVNSIQWGFKVLK